MKIGRKLEKKKFFFERLEKKHFFLQKRIKFSKAAQKNNEEKIRYSAVILLFIKQGSFWLYPYMDNFGKSSFELKLKARKRLKQTVK